MNSFDKATRNVEGLRVAAPPQPTMAEPSNGVRPPLQMPLFVPDQPVGPDELGRADDAAFLAEVLLHRRLETPFCLGLFGAAGSGKTHFLHQVVSAAADLASAGTAEGPFMADTVVVRVDAARPGEPGALLAGATLDRLAETHPALAADLAHAGADPAEAARTAGEALNDLRRRYQAERDTLDDLGSREARLTEAVIEAPASALDAYGRAHRSSIDSALRQFGFTSGDSLGTYKVLVREAAESPGLGARSGLSLRALWAYRGQTRLLVYAVLFALIAWGASVIAGDQASWIGALRDTSDKAAPVADWAQTHAHWLGPVQTLALVLSLLCLALVLLRAARFLRPILEGAGLLRRDVESRSRDLQGLLAHQTRRVDGLAAEVEASAKRASEAERRAGGPAGRGAVARKVAGSRSGEAEAVFFALGAAMAEGGDASPAPRRIVIAIDNLDARPAEAAAALLDAAHRLLGPGFVCLVAGSRTRLTDGFGETDPAHAFAQFERCVQVGYRLDAGQADETAWSAYAEKLVGAAPLAGRSTPTAATTGAAASGLDRPWRSREAETLAALSVFAGDTPRAVKRYVNLYRIARADPHLREAPAPVFTALALALALDAHGFPDDLAALARASHGEGAGESTVLRRALAVARDVSGEPVELGQAQRALDVAGRYAARA